MGRTGVKILKYQASETGEEDGEVCSDPLSETGEEDGEVSSYALSKIPKEVVASLMQQESLTEMPLTEKEARRFALDMQIQEHEEQLEAQRQLRVRVISHGCLFKPGLGSNPSLIWDSSV